MVGRRIERNGTGPSENPLAGLREETMYDRLRRRRVQRRANSNQQRTPEVIDLVSSEESGMVGDESSESMDSGAHNNHEGSLWQPHPDILGHLEVIYENAGTNTNTQRDHYLAFLAMVPGLYFGICYHMVHASDEEWIATILHYFPDYGFWGDEKTRIEREGPHSLYDFLDHMARFINAHMG